MQFLHKLFSKHIDPKNAKIIFFGTPQFATTVLEALLHKHIIPALIVTQPDKTSGRKRLPTPPPVKKLAIENKIPLAQPTKMDADFLDTLRRIHPDIIITVAYGKIFPESFLRLPKLGCLNVHASLLPFYRGASPIQEAILRGETTTGITLTQMVKELDAGPVYAKRAVTINPHMLYPEVSALLAQSAGEFLVETLPLILKGALKPEPQDASLATRCQLIEKEDGHIYWTETAKTIYDMYRAFFAWPGVYAFWKRSGSLTRVQLKRIALRDDTSQTNHPLGTVYLEGSGVYIQATQGSIEILEIQMEGKKPLPILDFVRGYDDFIGSVLQ